MISVILAGSIDCDHPAVRAFAEETASSGTPREQAVPLYYAIKKLQQLFK